MYFSVNQSIMKTPSKRIDWIDCLKLFAIFLVVWGHSMHHLGWEKEQFYTGVDGWIYSFHMPLFMILSGFFSVKLLEGKFEWKQRFINLIIPCITFGLFCIIVGINSLNFWFLKSLFICYLIVGLYCLKKVNNGTQQMIKFILLIVACFIIFPLLPHIPLLGAYKVDFMLPCFSFGIMLRKYFEFFKRHYIKIFISSFVLFFIGSCYWTKDSVWYSSIPNWIDYKELIINRQVIFHPSSLFENIFRYVVGFAGSMTFFCLFYRLSKIHFFDKCMTKISIGGRYTLHVYLMQSFLVEQNCLKVSVPTDNTLLYCYVYTFLYSLLIVGVCIFVAYWLMKNNYIAFLLFGKPLKNK